MTGSRNNSTFFWQGLLIVLPAILLAFFGLFSLRQDRILAEHEAAGQAKKISRDLAQVQIPRALKAEVISLESIARFQAAPLAAERDPVSMYASHDDGKLGWLMNAELGLEYPPPPAALPKSQSLDFEALSLDQSIAWNEAEQALFVDSDFDRAANQYRQFLLSDPEEPFAAIARFRLGVVLKKRDALLEAQAELDVLTREASEALSEAGFPISTLAALELLTPAFSSLISEDQRRARLTKLCAESVLNPSFFSGFVMRKAEAAETNFYAPPKTARGTEPTPKRPAIAAPWRKLWELHEQARVLHQHFLAATHSSSTTNDSTSQSHWLVVPESGRWLAVPERIDDEYYWVAAQKEQSLVNLMQRLLEAQEVPAYFGISVHIKDEPLIRVSRDAAVLANSIALPGASDGFPKIDVRVYLRDPSQLYARQRVRTRWFSLLIAASVAAVLIGFAAAWRAFRREQRLGEMKSNFVSSVSHELRAPIASVRLMAEELQDIGPQDRQKNKEYHRFIVQECRRLSALVENVLDFSRHEQGRKQYEFDSTDLVKLVHETTKLMQTYASERQLEISTIVRGQPVAIEADGRALQQALVNLIDNAIKHSPPGDKITVGLEFPAQAGNQQAAITSDPSPADSNLSVTHYESRITSHVSRFTRQPRIPGPCPAVLLWVADHGEGIPAEDHERIFERFYRRGSELRRETQGVGLGLAIVKYVTDAHDGKVSVQSAVGQGCRFTIELPLRMTENRTATS